MTAIENYEKIALLDEPAWPEAPGPHLFLLDASSSLEDRLLRGWIARHTPPDTHSSQVIEATIPPSRRRRRRYRNDPRLEANLRADDDPLLTPLRIVWLPPIRHGDRMVGWRDLLSFGDPRDPDPIRQEFIYRTRPERVRIVAGEPARASDLKRRWAEPGGRGRSDGTAIGDFVSLQASLALERAERGLRGSRYKVPKFLEQDLFESRHFAQGIARLARHNEVTFDAMAKRTKRYLKEIAATHSPYVIDLVAGGIRWLIKTGYQGLHYDREHLAELYTTSEKHSLVFLPSHKSNLDHLVLQYLLYENGRPPNHTAGGINMNFFPIGILIRRTGVFFIRREFKENEPYKFVLREYVAYLLEKRFPLEWYLEGGRSRSGKLRAPRYGMLSYVVGAYRAGASDDVVLVPVSIAYDQILDVGSYASEQQGGAKEKESFSWFLNAVRSLRRRYGAIHVRFGDPISLRDRLGPPNGHVDGRDLDIPKLAFEVAGGINAVTPITPISLVALALLTQSERSMTIEDTMGILEPFLDYVKRRNLPVTEPLALDTPERVRLALDSLTENKVVSRFTGATDTVYRVGADQHLAAAYYRNTVIHFFVNGAIAELALLGLADTPGEDATDAFLAEALRLRDLLKFEFFFSDRATYHEDMIQELSLHDPRWQERLQAGQIRDLLLSFRPFRSAAVLRPFLESYRVVGDAIERHTYESTIHRDALKKEALALGKQYELQGLLKTAESVSSVIMDSALDLADNRGLFERGPDMVECRLSFAKELREMVRRLSAIDALTAGRDAGIIGR